MWFIDVDIKWTTQERFYVIENVVAKNIKNNVASKHITCTVNDLLYNYL